DGALPELQAGISRHGCRKLAVELQEDPDSTALRIREMLDLISDQELNRLLTRETDVSLEPLWVDGTEVARHRKLRRANPEAQLAIFIDQLEDLFAGAFSLELQQKYISALAALVRCQKVHIIAALRSDSYAACRRFPELVALTNRTACFDLQPPLREEIVR